MNEEDSELITVRLKYAQLRIDYLKLEDRVIDTEKLLLRTLKMFNLMDKAMGPVYLKYLNEVEMERINKEKEQLETDRYMFS